MYLKWCQVLGKLKMLANCFYYVFLLLFIIHESMIIGVGLG